LLYLQRKKGYSKRRNLEYKIGVAINKLRERRNINLDIADKNQD